MKPFKHSSEGSPLSKNLTYLHDIYEPFSLGN